MFHWPRTAALRAGTLRDWMEETDGEGAFPTPLPARAIEALRAACAHDDDEAASPYANLNVDDTTDLMHAAHFLDATAVFKAGAQHLFGRLLAGTSVCMAWSVTTSVKTLLTPKRV